MIVSRAIQTGRWVAFRAFDFPDKEAPEFVNRYPEFCLFGHRGTHQRLVGIRMIRYTVHTHTHTRTITKRIMSD